MSGQKFSDSSARWFYRFSKKLLAEAKEAVSPGVGICDHGDGHVRFALIENTERTRQALRGIEQMFKAS